MLRQYSGLLRSTMLSTSSCRSGGNAALSTAMAPWELKPLSVPEKNGSFCCALDARMMVLRLIRTDLPPPDSPATIVVSLVCLGVASPTGIILPSGVGYNALPSSFHADAGRVSGIRFSASDSGGYNRHGPLAAVEPVRVATQARTGSPNVCVTPHTPHESSACFSNVRLRVTDSGESPQVAAVMVITQTGSCRSRMERRDTD
ncbi:hypothetical protein D3C86_1256460 [compost metagenome]